MFIILKHSIFHNLWFNFCCYGRLNNNKKNYEVPVEFLFLDKHIFVLIFQSDILAQLTSLGYILKKKK